MTKVVVNRCFGGFGISKEAEKLYLSKKGKEAFFYVDKGRIMDKRYVREPEDGSSHYHYTFTRDMGDEFSEWPTEDGVYFYDFNLDRDDPDLVATVEELGSKAASDRFAKLEVVEVPDDVEWYIDEYDGTETVAEKHRSW